MIVTESIQSKAEALILLAKADDHRCKGGTYLLRVLSKYPLNQRTDYVPTIKRRTARCSVEAYEARRKLLGGENPDNRSLYKQTVLEHPEPLNVVWNWLVESRDRITSEAVLERVFRYPPVLILKSEDDEMNRKGFRQSGDPEDRFRSANIKLVDDQELRQNTELVFLP